MGPLYRRWLERCSRAGVEWSPGTAYLSGEPRAGGATLNLLSGRRAVPVRARFVVGADGARSRVARDLGLDRNRRWIAGLEEVLPGAPLDGPPAFHVFLDPALAPGYIAWVVNDGEEAHVGVGGHPGFFDPRRALDSFRASLRGIIDLSGARVAERRGGLIPVGGVLRRLACPSGLLVGDAAGAPSPLTAGGLDPCLRLSALAASVIGDHLASGDPQALTAYSGDRFRARFISRLWMRGAMDRLRHPLLLELACAALRAPTLSALARHIFFGRGSFPDITVRAPALAPRPQDTAEAP
jgi:flavin-dependent dehydrogenase